MRITSIYMRGGNDTQVFTVLIFMLIKVNDMIIINQIEISGGPWGSSTPLSAVQRQCNKRYTNSP